MSKSADYMFRCQDTIKGDPNISKETIAIMFVEFGRLLLEEQPMRKQTIVVGEWFPMRVSEPDVYGKYEVYRKGCSKQHYETWNGTGWASNNSDITHWRYVVPPTE